jgi:hypothetical protein
MSAVLPPSQWTVGYTPSLADWQSALDGTALGSPIAFTSSGTYTPSTGARVIRVRGIGAGGAGGGSSSTPSGTCTACSGGAAGSYFEAWFLVSALSGTVAISIGAAGVGTNANGIAGGSSSFGSFAVAPGGGGGGVQSYATTIAANYAAQAIPGNIPTFSGTLFAIGWEGQPGFNGMVFAGTPMSGQGAPSQLGGGARNTNNGQGTAGSGFGAGGGGAGVPQSAGALLGGNGAPGYLDILEYS